MTNPAPGRHRANAPAGRGGSVTWVLGVAGVALVILGATAMVVSRSEDVPAPPEPTSAGPTTLAPDAGAVETTRMTTVDSGSVVTVEEVSRVVSDADVVAEPSRATPTGLRLISLRVTGQDGRSAPFTAPMEVSANGSLSVTARYRVIDCPDVLPATWPAPTGFPDALQSYVRLDQPLHTAAAICPQQKFSSQRSSQLTGALVSGAGVRVRLTWTGDGRLSVAGIGSASGVAAVPVERSPACASDPSCVAILDPATAPNATLSLEPADPCPPGTDTDRLVLLVSGGSSPSAPLSLDVKGLYRAVCRQ